MAYFLSILKVLNCVYLLTILQIIVDTNAFLNVDTRRVKRAIVSQSGPPPIKPALRYVENVIRRDDATLKTIQTSKDGFGGALDMLYSSQVSLAEFRKALLVNSYYAMQIRELIQSVNSPRNVELDPKIKIQLYFQEGPFSEGYHELTANSDEEEVSQLKLAANSRLVLLIGGWQSTLSTNWVPKARENLLSEASRSYGAIQSLVVAEVDWLKKNSETNYWTSLSEMNECANTAAKIIKKFKYSSQNDKNRTIECVGDSIGGHVCGLISNNLRKKFDSILAFDPSSLGFENTNSSIRLDKNQAKQLTTIHSDSQILGSSLQSTGHAQIFIDGHDRESRCKNHWCMPVFALKLMQRPDDTCSHIAFKCSDLEYYRSGSCGYCDKNNKQCAIFGPRTAYHSRKSSTFASNGPGNDSEVEIIHKPIITDLGPKPLVKKPKSIAARSLEIDADNDYDEDFDESYSKEMNELGDPVAELSEYHPRIDRCLDPDSIHREKLESKDAQIYYYKPYSHFPFCAHTYQIIFHMHEPLDERITYQLHSEVAPFIRMVTPKNQFRTHVQGLKAYTQETKRKDIDIVVKDRESVLTQIIQINEDMLSEGAERFPVQFEDIIIDDYKLDACKLRGIYINYMSSYSYQVRTMLSSYTVFDPKSCKPIDGNLFVSCTYRSNCKKLPRVIIDK